MKIGIIGSTNAGKSTLFNRMVGSQRAIITDVHGTTRDILYHEIDHETIGKVTLLDTPGLDTFEEEIPYIQTVIEESDLLLFVIDGNVGLAAKEQDIYKLISQSGKKSQTILLVNKLESAFSQHTVELAIAEYYGLGCVEVLPVVAKQNKGIQAIRRTIHSLKDTITISSDQKLTTSDADSIPLAIIGKPNAGKSTLLNTLLGEDRALVSDIPGTTLDYNTGQFEYGKHTYTLYDTAGIKKKGKIKGLERIAYSKTTSMLKYVRPYVVYVINGDEGLTHRDMTILEEIIGMQLPLIIALNKVDKLTQTQIDEYHRLITISFQFAKYLPIIDISAQNGDGVDQLFEILGRMRIEKDEQIATPELNKIIRTALVDRPPRFPKNKICKISYITQVETNPPTFMVFVNNTKRATSAFKKRLENTIRLESPFV